ncbi:hypothetical protein CEXT_311981 [Caerostris extrusa]|uniref:Uncharacterized protein n=1 Tax=Caerostris extrusa TaxID=172846 RepID=A0AAV4RJL1_CAEEX|nr:hypothetical protein CEXT_311981 [Caerostris extrusa]
MGLFGCPNLGSCDSPIEMNPEPITVYIHIGKNISANEVDRHRLYSPRYPRYIVSGVHYRLPSPQRQSAACLVVAGRPSGPGKDTQFTTGRES